MKKTVDMFSCCFKTMLQICGTACCRSKTDHFKQKLKVCLFKPSINYFYSTKSNPGTSQSALTWLSNYSCCSSFFLPWLLLFLLCVGWSGCVALWMAWNCLLCRKNYFIDLKLNISTTHDLHSSNFKASTSDHSINIWFGLWMGASQRTPASGCWAKTSCGRRRDTPPGAAAQPWAAGAAWPDAPTAPAGPPWPNSWCRTASSPRTSRRRTSWPRPGCLWRSGGSAAARWSVARRAGDLIDTVVIEEKIQQVTVTHLNSSNAVMVDAWVCTCHHWPAARGPTGISNCTSAHFQGAKEVFGG